jgi:hypothetical protein
MLIALTRLERRPPRLDLQLYPHLPRADVGRTDPGVRRLMGWTHPDGIYVPR